MQILFDAVTLIVSYLLGSIPVGLLLVKLKTGKDLREVESGRTGWTNAFRAAGFGIGFVTAILDTAKAALAVWVARSFDPTDSLIHVLAGLAAILGHSYSIFLAERDDRGRLRLRGGAGAMPALGGAVGLWSWTFPIVFVIGAIILFTLGMASVATLAVGLAIIIVFSVRASMGLMPWVSVLYGLVAEFILIWALRPNIQKIFAGNERVISISLAGWLRARKANAEAGDAPKDSK